MTGAANFTDEIGKMEKIVQKDCGQELRLIFISGPGLSMAHVANVTQANKDCVRENNSCKSWKHPPRRPTDIARRA